MNRKKFDLSVIIFAVWHFEQPFPFETNFIVVPSFLIQLCLVLSQLNVQLFDTFLGLCWAYWDFFYLFDFICPLLLTLLFWNDHTRRCLCESCHGYLLFQPGKELTLVLNLKDNCTFWNSKFNIQFSNLSTLEFNLLYFKNRKYI